MKSIFRKYVNRSLSFILSFLMIFSLIQLNTLVVNAEEEPTDNIVDESTDPPEIIEGVNEDEIEVFGKTVHSQEEAVKWAYARAKEHWEIPDGSGWTQCVEFLWYYYDYLLGTTYWDIRTFNADQYLTAAAACPSGWSRPDISSARPGDIVVWGPWAGGVAGGVGHIGVIIKRDGNTLTTAETNAGSTRGWCDLYTRDLNGISGLIRPDFPNTDTTKPTISNIKVTDVSLSGYTVTCNVTDNVGVTRVAFPTWTEQNGQDDLLWKDGSISGNTATFRVNVSDHKNERNCKYITHIYAYDAAGNYNSAGTEVVVQEALKGKVTISGVTKYGQILSASITESNASKFTYQWKRNNTNISGSTSSSYTLTKDDIGKNISCEVKDGNGVYSGSIISSATSAIEKADGPAKPTGLTGIPTSKRGLSDGMITGVDTTMEYAYFSDVYFPCTSSTITGLKAGLYRVRYKETDTNKASEYAMVPVGDGRPVTEVFVDVQPGAWYVDAIQFVYDRDIMTGTGTGDTFEPNSPLTRGQFVTVLYSMEGRPEVQFLPIFDDVSETAFYARPTIWAYNNGITAGTGNGKFSPNKNITREQLAVMLYKYASMKDYDVTINGNALNNFVDKDDVSPYAKEAMKWAVTQGIISGKGEGRLDPQGNATRAESAAMIMRLLQKNDPDD